MRASPQESDYIDTAGTNAHVASGRGKVGWNLVFQPEVGHD